jgi:hypothetical protein
MQHEDRVDVIRKAIQSIEQKLQGHEAQKTVAEFIRLLQLEKELDPDQPHEVIVTWVESIEEPPVAKQ